MGRIGLRLLRADLSCSRTGGARTEELNESN